MARILLVDDDPALLSALPEALVRRLPGCTIETAASAEAALTMLRQGGFDLVISDLVMCGSGGVGLMKSSEGLKPSVPTILITGMPETPDEPFPSLAVGVVQKPFDISRLVALVREVLERSVS
jgi:DNA-binding NtrC family response regulator